MATALMTMKQSRFRPFYLPLICSGLLSVRLDPCGALWLPDCGQQEMRRGESHWEHCSLLTTRLNEAFVRRLDVFSKKSPLLHITH